MSVGLIGIGRMGKVLAKILAKEVELYIYDRDANKMKAAAEELGIKTVTELEQLADLEMVILAVPDREVISCIKIFNSIKKPIKVISIATNVGQYMLQSVAASNVTCIGAKIVGQADEIALGQKPVIIVNNEPAELTMPTKELFTNVGKVIVDKADLVYTINTIVAEKVIEAAVHVEENLKKHNINDPDIIKSALKQVGAGIIKAYADDNLGPFAREIVQAVKVKIRNNKK